MRLALISDLHGNFLALEAVLADLGRRGVDRLLCLGDVCTLGPRPSEVLARLADLGCACVLGNHDEFLLEPGLVHRYTEAPPILAAVERCAAQRSDAERAMLQTFARTLSVDLDHGRRLLAFHGSPRSHVEDLWATSPAEQLDDALGPHDAHVLVGGHTHVAMVRQHRGALLVNPGSLGLAFEAPVRAGGPRVLPHAEYAVIESTAVGVSVALHRVALDPRRLVDEARGWRDPFATLLAAQYT
jgi:putative phosphoesterase